MRLKTLKMVHRLIAAVIAVILCGGSANAQSSAKLAEISLPPMGWASWNSFSNTVDSRVVEDQARAMISSGLQKAGYQYVNIDEGWWLGQRDAHGNILVDAKAWPALKAGEQAGDMANIVRFIHGLGLKAGIYTDAGESGCSMGPDLGPRYFHTGSEGHYEQDFLQFARWGFDYVKVDWCGGNKENLDPAVQYAEIAHAIARAERMTEHRLYFSICEWGRNSPWTWAPNVGGSPVDIWRTSSDIVKPIVAGNIHADRKASFTQMLSNFDQGVHPEAQHTGFYNDPDMMVLGMPGLTDEQNRIHMALWAMSGAPLLIGADLTKLSSNTLAALMNPNVLAVDQDAAGLQAVKVAEPANGLQVWSKALAESGRRAVLLLNRTNSPAVIAVKWSELGLSRSPVEVRDAWTGSGLRSAPGSYAATVPAGDGRMLLVKGTEKPTTSYKPLHTEDTGTARELGSISPHHPVRFVNVQSGSSPRMVKVQIAYSNSDAAPRYAELRVNEQVATRIAFPSTGGRGADRMVWIQVSLDGGRSDNVLTFSNDCQDGPVIHSITVEIARCMTRN